MIRSEWEFIWKCEINDEPIWSTQMFRASPRAREGCQCSARSRCPMAEMRDRRRSGHPCFRNCWWIIARTDDERCQHLARSGLNSIRFHIDIGVRSLGWMNQMKNQFHWIGEYIELVLELQKNTRLGAMDRYMRATATHSNLVRSTSDTQITNKIPDVRESTNVNIYMETRIVFGTLESQQWLVLATESQMQNIEVHALKLDKHASPIPQNKYVVNSSINSSTTYLRTANGKLQAAMVYTWKHKPSPSNWAIQTFRAQIKLCEQDDVEEFRRSWQNERRDRQRAKCTWWTNKR